MSESSAVHKATIDHETISLRPDQISNLKKSVVKTLYTKKNKWNDEL